MDYVSEHCTQFFISALSITLMNMPGNRKTNHETGQLSIDFVIGFTIFMIAFIFVSTMISGLLINIHTREIDYDAVAYRTSVILVEDPGEPSDWNLLDLTKQDERNNLKRLGLGIARNNPGILKESKIEKFFDPDTTGACNDPSRLCYPSDYSQRLIFGDYPYNFNISLKELEMAGPGRLERAPQMTQVISGGLLISKIRVMLRFHI